MKKIFTTIAIFLFLISIVQRANAHVRLLSPANGTTLIIAGTVTISWERIQEHDQNNWDLYFSTDGGTTWDELQLDIPVDQFTYNWEVPNSPTSQAMIKVIQDNNIEMNYEDSKSFTIEAGSVDYVTVLSPVEGAELTANESTVITWEVFQSSGQNNWDLYLSTDNGATWNELQLDIPVEQMYYKWSIPDNASTQAKIRVVQDNTGDNQEAESAAFTIIGTTTAVEKIVGSELELVKNYPNPVRSLSNFAIKLDKKKDVLLEIYSTQGSKLETLIDREMNQGEHIIFWDASKYNTGMYFYRLTAGNQITTKQLLVTK